MNVEENDVMRLLFDRSPDPVLLIQDEQFVDCNDAAVNIMKAEGRKHLLNVRPSEISPQNQPDGRLSSEKASDLIQTAIQTGGQHFEWVHVNLNGDEFWVEVALTLLEIDGKPTIYTVWRDISDRKQAESESRRNREMFKALFEKSPDSILVIRDGSFVYCNDAAVQTLRAESIEQVMNTKPADLSPEFQPDGRLSSEKAPEMIQNAIDSGANHFEWVHIRLDGEEFWVEVALTLADIEGDPLVYSVWRDISARKDAERRLQEHVNQLSNPVIKLWDEIVLLPIVGVLDTARSQKMIDSVLDAVVRENARVVILDVTGMAEIDTAVARHIMQTVGAAHILGAEVIITGFRPASAQTLAQLGVDFASIHTRGSLRDGVDDALSFVGYRVVNDR